MKHAHIVVECDTSFVKPPWILHHHLYYLQREATLAYKTEAADLQRQLRHLQSQFDMLSSQASTLTLGRRARVGATSVVNRHLTTIDDSLSGRNLQPLMKELDEMEKINAKLSAAVEDVTLEHVKKNEIVKHHSQEIGLQWRVFVDFFCNPEQLRSQVRELTARVRALQNS